MVCLDDFALLPGSAWLVQLSDRTICIKRSRKKNPANYHTQPNSNKKRLYTLRVFWNFLKYLKILQLLQYKNLRCFFCISALHQLLFFLVLSAIFCFVYFVHFFMFFFLLPFFLSLSILLYFAEGYTPVPKGNYCYLLRPSLCCPLSVEGLEETLLPLCTYVSCCIAESVCSSCSFRDKV